MFLGEAREGGLSERHTGLRYVNVKNCSDSASERNQRCGRTDGDQQKVGQTELEPVPGGTGLGVREPQKRRQTGDEAGEEE